MPTESKVDLIAKRLFNALLLVRLVRAWLLLPGEVGVLLISSYFTGFCPVYYTLDKLGVGEGHGTPAATA